MLNNDGQPLDANFAVNEDAEGLSVVLESRGAGRNNDYSEALTLILERLGHLGSSLTSIHLERARNETRPAAERRVKPAGIGLPIDLSNIDNFDELRKRISQAQAALGRKPGASGAGNGTKRIRMRLDHVTIPRDQLQSSLTGLPTTTANPAISRSPLSVTSREAVLRAIRECDELGRGPFLHKYGYREALSYFLAYEGRHYDTKAIIGVAFGHQHSLPPLANDEFSGGKTTVEKALTRMGFRVEASHANLEQPHAGDPQTTPQDPAQDTLTVHVYSAGGDDGRVFVHPVRAEMAPANLRVGDEVVLDIQGAVVRGIISEDKANVWLRTTGLPADWNHQRITDALTAVGITHPATVTASIVARNGRATATEDPHSLSRHAEALAEAGVAPPQDIGSETPQKVDRTVSDFKRDPNVVRVTLERAKGTCERCRQPAPFKRGDGTPYLEVHHVETLAEGGRDKPDNAVALCPNCHRFMHHASPAERDQAKQMLLDSSSAKG